MTYQAFIDAASVVIAARRSAGVPESGVGCRLAHLLADAGFSREMLIGFQVIIEARLDLLDKVHQADEAIERRHAKAERSDCCKQGTPAFDASPARPGADGADHACEPTDSVPA